MAANGKATVLRVASGASLMVTGALILYLYNHLTKKSNARTVPDKGEHKPSTTNENPGAVANKSSNEHKNEEGHGYTRFEMEDILNSIDILGLVKETPEKLWGPSGAIVNQVRKLWDDGRESVVYHGVTTLHGRLAQNTRRMMQPTLNELFDVVGGEKNVQPNYGRGYPNPEDFDNDPRLARYGITAEEAKILREAFNAEKFYYTDHYGLGDLKKVAILRALELGAVANKSSNEHKNEEGHGYTRFEIEDILQSIGKFGLLKEATEKLWGPSGAIVNKARIHWARGQEKTIQNCVTTLHRRLAKDTRRMMQPTLDALYDVVGGEKNVQPNYGRSYPNPEDFNNDSLLHDEYGITAEEAKILREAHNAKKFYYTDHYGLDDPKKVAILRDLELLGANANSSKKSNAWNVPDEDEHKPRDRLNTNNRESNPTQSFPNSPDGFVLPSFVGKRVRY